MGEVPNPGLVIAPNHHSEGLMRISTVDINKGRFALGVIRSVFTYDGATDSSLLTHVLGGFGRGYGLGEDRGGRCPPGKAESTTNAA